MAISEDEDPFDVLGLDETALEKDVASAFRRKSLSCHPDRHPDDPTARVRFDRLSRAKESLLDPERRQAWEHFRKHGTWAVAAGSPESKGKGKGPQPGEWVDRGGFRARAPHERKRMEHERVQKGDEEAFQQYQAQRRAEAQKHIKASRGGRLGTADGRDVGMEEARRALAERLEREVDPKVKRQQRAEEEKRQREEEKKMREDAQRQRNQQWWEREQQQAAKTRQLNEAKRRHWQGWRSHASMSASVDDEHAGRRVPMSPMVGRWLYGKKPNEYCISENEDGTLYFSGPDPDSAGRLCGTLLVDGEWHEVDLTSAQGVPFGRMRFTYVTNDEGEEGLISQFQKAGRSDWGREMFARRDTITMDESLQGDGKGQESSSCSCSTSKGVCETNTMSGEAAPPECGTAVDQPALLNVCVVVDQELGIFAEIEIKRGSTLLDVKEFLMADAATGSAGLQDFALGLVSTGSHDEVQQLPETLELTEAHTTLHLIPILPDLRASPQQPPEQDACDQAPGLATSAAVAGEPEPDLPSELLAWLQAHRLNAYHEAMLRNGYLSLSELCSADAAKHQELISLLEMKPGHAMRFKKALRECTKAVGTHNLTSPILAPDRFPLVAEPEEGPEQAPAVAVGEGLEQDLQSELFAPCAMEAPEQYPDLAASTESPKQAPAAAEAADLEHDLPSGCVTPPMKAPERSPDVAASAEDLELAPTAAVSGELEQDTPSDLLLWLRAHRLDTYHEAILENWYQSLDDLCSAQSHKHEELISCLKMKPGHAVRFRRALRQGSKS